MCEQWAEACESRREGFTPGARSGSFRRGMPRTTQAFVCADMKRVIQAFLPLLLVLACQAQLIPNTDVEDTDQNRALVEFCERYRKAVEHRNISFLLQIAHPDYYEDGGNIDSSDDIDRVGLEKHLRERFIEARQIRYEIRYRRVGKGRNDTFYVDYTYSASYQVPDGKGDEQWRRVIEDNRLELVPHRDSFLVLSGM